MAPNIDGHTLDIGDDICDDTPACCGDDMTRGTIKPNGHPDWTCPCCKTTVNVDADGCVDHITA